MEQRINAARECCINGDGVSVILAADFTDHKEYRKIKMSNDLANYFREIAINHISDLTAKLSDGNYRLVEYDAGYRTESHEIDYIDTNQSVYDGLKSILLEIPNIHDISMFDGDEEITKRLSFYIIQIQDVNRGIIKLLRRYSPKKELSRGKLFGALFKNGTFDKLEDKVFLFDEQIDVFEFEQVLFINSMYNFQLIFKYFEQLRTYADVILSDINTAIPISNFGEFQDCCKGQMQMLAKIQNISRKSYFKDVTMDDLKRTIQAFRLNVQTTIENGEEKILFEKKNRWDILKLLDDDYLGSIMTNMNYIVNSKKVV